MVNALSIDLEDWYHICGLDFDISQSRWQEYSVQLEENVNKILYLLSRFNINATFFIVGIIAKNNPGLVRKIINAGHEIATHGFLHRRIFDMNPKEFEEDLLASKIAIEKAAGKEILGYRAPEWSLKRNNIWTLDILRKHGFSYDASAVPLSHLSGKCFNFYPYEIKTKYGNIIEFPLSTFRCLWERIPFSGGLSMRIFPYFYILDCTKMINRLGYPVMFYLHPWELDTKHVKIDLPFNRKFMHYFNLKSTSKKIELLLERLEFSTVEETLGLRKHNHRKSNLPAKYGKYYDTVYFKSASKFLVLATCLYSIILIIALLLKQLSFLLIIVLCTIFYWPWGRLFSRIETLFEGTY